MNSCSTNRCTTNARADRAVVAVASAYTAWGRPIMAQAWGCSKPLAIALALQDQVLQSVVVPCPKFQAAYKGCPSGTQLGHDKGRRTEAAMQA